MNRLAEQSSPYLLQHADNPVDWQPWDAEALALAATSDKPILLSIGYSACHWCHVMAHESFADPATAALMNAHYVNIKVDREERPDLDKIYQTAHQVLTRNRGGWPLTLFLTPTEQVPFFGGTYFPREARGGLPGFKDVLVRVAAAYDERRDELAAFTAEMRAALTANLRAAPAPATVLAPDLIEGACALLAEQFDAVAGGFGGAPKFPHPSSLEFLLAAKRHTAAARDAVDVEHMVMHTLSAMAAGGIHDQIGGGFYRYSVDAGWNIPHFEKMLYDNGPLLWLYAEAARLSGAPHYAVVAAQLADWVLAEMRTAGAAFCASMDADSEGEEGRYYLWSREEVATLLGADYDVFAARYGLERPPNFEHRWHLRLVPGAPAMPPATDNASLRRSRERLAAHRATRVSPGRDDKVLVAWNALMIRGLTHAGLTLGRDDYLDAAADALAWLRAVHWRDGRLAAASRAGHAHLNAYLDDYALLAQAALELLCARWNAATLGFAIALVEVLLDQFEDTVHGGFFFTSRDHEVLLERTKSYADDALPAGNAIAASVLLELGHLLGETRYLDAAERALKAAAPLVENYPSAHAAMCQALIDYLDPPTIAILRSDDPVLLADYTAAARRLTPRRIRCYALPALAAGEPGLLAARAARPGAPITVYVCNGQACAAPVGEREAMLELLRG